MTVILNPEKVTAAFIAMLDAQLEKPVGDHGTDGIDTSGAYHTVYRIEGGGATGSYGDPHQDLTLTYQVNTIGRTRSQCEGLAWEATNIIVEIAAAGGHVHALSGTGWTGGLREQQTFDAPHFEGTDDTGQEVWAQRERFKVAVHRA